MKQVSALEILGNPARADRQAACPDCSARACVFEDGSVMCVAEGGKCFEPDPANPHDRDLVEMRRAYDEANGITATDRVVIPARLKAELAESSRS